MFKIVFLTFVKKLPYKIKCYKVNLNTLKRNNEIKTRNLNKKRKKLIRYNIV